MPSSPILTVAFMLIAFVFGIVFIFSIIKINNGCKDVWGSSDESGSKATHFRLMEHCNLDAYKFIRVQSQSIHVSCNNQFGIGLINSWSSKRVEICLSSNKHDAGSKISPNGSSIVAWPFHLENSSTAYYYEVYQWPKMIIALCNVTMSSLPTRADGSLRENSIRASCSRLPITSPFDPWTIKLANEQVLSAINPTEVTWGSSEGCGSSTNIIDHPVLMIQRYDATNAYHHLEDLSAMFMSLAVLDSHEVKSKGVEVVFLRGPSIPGELGLFSSIWQRMAIPGLPIRFLDENPYPENTCFRHIIQPAYAHRSVMNSAWYQHADEREGTTLCRSGLYIGLRQWLKEAIFPDLFTAPSTFPRIKTYTVVWISRKNFESIQKKSKFWTDHQDVRTLENEDSLLLEMQKGILEWNAKACFRDPGKWGCRSKEVVWRLESVELSDTSFFPEQLQRLSRARILAGVHGAGLTNMIYLQDQGAVLELNIKSLSEENPHYSTLASLLGLSYMRANEEGFASALIKLMDQVYNI